MNLRLIIPFLIVFFFRTVCLVTAQDLPSEHFTGNDLPISSGQSDVSLQMERTSGENLSGTTLVTKNPESKTRQRAAKSVSPDLKTLRLKNKIIPLSSPVYEVIEYFEAKGYLGFLPQAKPYTKIFIAELLAVSYTHLRAHETRH